MNVRDTVPQFLSTAEAAKMLGLSTTLIQTLVDKNELSGWKTRGGHRRIALQSVLDYQINAKTGHGVHAKPRHQPKVMVVAETPGLRASLERASASWRFPFEFKLLDSITAALLELPQERPDVLIVELTIPRQQQERTLAALQDFIGRGHPVSIALVTEETGLAANAPAGPNGIQVAPGPLTSVWLHAFLTGVQASWRH